jgi:hypothetical protein
MSGKINIEKNKPYNIKNYLSITNRTKNTFSKTFKSTLKSTKENSDLIKFDFKKSTFEAKNFNQYEKYVNNDIQNRSTSKKLMAQTFNFNKSKNNITGEKPQLLEEDLFIKTSKKINQNKNSSKILLNGKFKSKANYSTIENNKINNNFKGINNYKNNNNNNKDNDYDNHNDNDNPCYFSYNSKRGDIQNFTNLTRRKHFVNKNIFFYIYIFLIILIIYIYIYYDIA